MNLVLTYFKNTSLIRNIQYDSVWKLFHYDKSRGVVLTSLCVRVMCVRESIKAARIIESESRMNVSQVLNSIK